jgi:hypothetical protein
VAASGGGRGGVGMGRGGGELHFEREWVGEKVEGGMAMIWGLVAADPPIPHLVHFLDLAKEEDECMLNFRCLLQ